MEVQLHLERFILSGACMSDKRPEVLVFAHSIDEMIERAKVLNLALATYLLKIVRLDLTAKIFEINDEELAAFTDFVRNPRSYADFEGPTGSG
jgi:hypothetical protein